ncbi:MAG: site-2 protease family protein [Cyclobacteriaceae bacterium]|nr:site-2 protease family protein [Cyclobacteriaceae bacterium]
MELTPRKVALHLGLFLATFITTTLAGAEWIYGKSILVPGYTWADFLSGMPYSIPFLLILSVHEFGHYFTAVHYRIRTTLPYYIPLPPLPFMIGTLGALIRLKSRVESRKQTFDVGIAGPLAGFVATLAVLGYGFATLPPPEFIFQIHPNYQQYGLEYANYVYTDSFLGAGGADIVIGKNLLYLGFEKLVGDPSRVPNIHEIIHYPYLFAGFLALVFTSINLLPIGQLDGGHVLYGLLGYHGHRKVAAVVFMIFIFYAGLGSLTFFGPEADPIWYMPLYVAFLYLTLTGLRRSWQDTLMYAMIIFVGQLLLAWVIPGIKGYPGWLPFAFIIGRFIGVEHPPCLVEEPLDTQRQWLGWFALLVFVLSFASAPIEVIIFPPPAP